MTLDRAHRSSSRSRRPVISALAFLVMLGAVFAGPGHADPADDALTKLNELSRQAEQTTEAMHSAQLDLNKKLEIQQAAEVKHTNDVAAVDAAKRSWPTSSAKSTPSPPPSTWGAGPRASRRCSPRPRRRA